MQPTEEEQYYEHWRNEQKQKVIDQQRAREAADKQYWEQRRRDEESRRYAEEMSSSASSSGYSTGYSAGNTTDYAGSGSGGGAYRTSPVITALVLLGFVLVIFMIIWGPAGGITHLLGVFQFASRIVKGIYSFFAAIFKINVYVGIAVLVGAIVLLKKIFG